MITSKVKFNSTSMAAASLTPGTESAAESANNAVTTATAILTATDTIISTHPAGSSGVSDPSGTVSAVAAECVEKNGWVTGAIAAAGLVMAL